MTSKKPVSKKHEVVALDEGEEQSDDAIVGKAVFWSLVVIVPLLLLGSVVAYWLTRKPTVVVENRSKESALSKLRDTKSIDIPQFVWTDVTDAVGLDFVHCNGHSSEKLLPETMGGGVACFDFDQDGHTDLLFTNSCYWEPAKNEAERPSVALYRNQGNGTFANVTKQVGLETIGYGMGVAIGDYNGDRWPDVFLSYLGQNRLFRNEGGKNFVDVTLEAGVAGNPNDWSTSCGWFDANNDGNLDLVVCNYLEWSKESDIALGSTLNGVVRAYSRPDSFGGRQPYLYINQGNGTFREVAAEAGLHITNPAHDGTKPVAVPKSLGLAFCDIDNDGLMDIFIANDTVQNLFFRNKGDGTFEEMGMKLGVAFDSNGRARGAMGIDVRFIRRDSQLATVIGNFANEPVSFFVRQNLAGVNVMTDEAMSAGIGPPSRLELTFGTLLFDAFLAGRLDLLTANGHLETEIEEVQPNQSYRQSPHLFWNTGQRGADVSEFVSVPKEKAGSALTAPMVARGAAYLDYDSDGDLDLVLVGLGDKVRFLRNDQAFQNKWVHVKLLGPAGNVDGLGALVTVRSGDLVQKQWISPTRSYLSQVEPIAYFGLGKNSKIDGIDIEWPGGKKQTVAGDQVKINSRIVVEYEAE
ncbi:MAG: CRTAC1 family protein [Planctomycetaceae bacterium]|nr:CRTAC1 family protein [Planctomycetaceae bacterium]